MLYIISSEVFSKQELASDEVMELIVYTFTFTDKVIRDGDAEAIKEALMMTKVEKLIYQDAEADVTKRRAKNLLGSGSNIDYVVENTGLKKETVVELYNSIMAEKQQ